MSAPDGHRWVRPLTPSRADERYDQIYETAARLFYEKGYARTSLQDLATAVGLQKGSLYHYIDSKQDLLFGITEYAHRFFLQRVAEIDGSDRTPLAELERTIERHAEFVATNFHITAVFYNERTELTPEHQDRVVRTRDNYEARLRQLVRYGQATGEIAADLNPRIAVLGMLGMVNWMHQWYRADGSWSPEELARSFATMCVRALRPAARAG